MIAALFAALLVAHQPTGGPHDFDYQFGNWNVSISRLVHHADGRRAWVKLHGTHNVTPLWGGKSNVGVLEVDGPGGHLEGMQVRLFNPKTKQWSLTFSSSRTGVFGAPSIGGFADGRGEFYDEETDGGLTVLNRSVTTNLTPTSYRDEEAVSRDGGKTWEVNWIAIYTRAKGPERGT